MYGPGAGGLCSGEDSVMSGARDATAATDGSDAQLGTQLGNGPLPTRSEVLQACRDSASAGHPLLRAAGELTALHRRRLILARRITGEIDEYRAQQVHAIDRWVAPRLPIAHGGAYLHTETIGAVLDRLARLTACAEAALAAESDWDIWFAWERLAELAVGYEDLVAELAIGRRRLPSGS